MYHEVLCAGFGGQGIMLLGKLLAYAGMREGRFVTYLPSYGAEVRGGTAHCSVIISSGEIASPIVATPSIAVIMNQPSLMKFEPRVKPGGLMLVNSTLVLSETQRTDIEMFSIPATQAADTLGTVRCANIVMLGCLIARSGIVSAATVEEGLAKTFSRKPELLETNRKALNKGRELFEQVTDNRIAARD
jgi:2-oxoglutarate ferredoxin oxidoreductase subunit gamma